MKMKVTVSMLGHVSFVRDFYEYFIYVEFVLEVKILEI